MPFLVLQFIILSAIVCISGIYVTKSTVKLSKEIGLGDVLGGLIVLAIVTNLPEIAIITASAVRNELEIGISNILGGIAIQTVVSCLFDFFRSDKTRPFSDESSSNQMIVEGLMVIFILSLVMMGHYLPPSLTLGRIPLVEFSIVLFWILGLIVLNHDKKNSSQTKKEERGSLSRLKTIKLDKTFAIFTVSALATLVSGYYLEEVSSELATDLGMTGVVFGATILAFVTALPEVSTGLEAIFLKRNRLAFSDIFGGNAFLPCLFLPAAIYTGHSIVTLAKPEDMYLTALGILLTVIYTAGLTIKSKRTLLTVGFDTIAALLFYGAGVVGLVMMKLRQDLILNSQNPFINIAN